MGYITDLGMTGPMRSVLGIEPELSVSRFLGNPPKPYRAAGGECKLEGAVFQIEENGRCLSVEKVRIL